MEKLSSNILRFHHINEKKLESWTIEAIQLNEYLGVTDEEIVKVVVEVAKNWNDRVCKMTHDNFLLAVDAKLRQKYASRIETQEYTKHRGEKTQELVSNVQESTQRFLDPMCFDPKEIESKYEEPYNNRT